jgi:hypothetical protein
VGVSKSTGEAHSLITIFLGKKLLEKTRFIRTSQKQNKCYLWILRLIVRLRESRCDKFDVCVELEWLVLFSKDFPEGVTCT